MQQLRPSKARPDNQTELCFISFILLIFKNRLSLVLKDNVTLLKVQCLLGINLNHSPVTNVISWLCFDHRQSFVESLKRYTDEPQRMRSSDNKPCCRHGNQMFGMFGWKPTSQLCVILTNVTNKHSCTRLFVSTALNRHNRTCWV